MPDVDRDADDPTEKQPYQPPPPPPPPPPPRDAEVTGVNYVETMAAIAQLLTAVGILAFIMYRIHRGQSITSTEEILLAAAMLTIFGQQIIQAVTGRAVGVRYETRDHDGRDRHGDDD